MGCGKFSWKSLLLLTAALCSACTVKAPRNIADSDPSSKIPAIVAKVEEKDFSAVKQLVADLESDDPAVRFYAIGGLQRLTGETLGYQYFVDDEQRADAVGRWKAWLDGWTAGRQAALSKP
jgi:hypothetical protein